MNDYYIDIEQFCDGVLFIEVGKIVVIGEYQVFCVLYFDVFVIDYWDCLILFGFIDMYLYFLQIEIIVKYGE